MKLLIDNNSFESEMMWLQRGDRWDVQRHIINMQLSHYFAIIRVLSELFIYFFHLIFAAVVLYNC